MEPVKPVEHTAPADLPKAAAAPERRQEPVRQPDRQDHRNDHRSEHRSDHRSDRRPERKPDLGPKPEPVHYAQAMKPSSSTPRVEVTPVDASQLPAFLLRPVKLPKAPEKAAKAAEKTAVAAKPKTTEKKPRAPRKKAIKTEPETDKVGDA